MNPSVLQQFLQRVGRRQTVAAFARRLRLFLLIAFGVYALALLVSRLLGLLPSAWFTPVTLAVPPAAALLLAWIFYHRPDAAETARLADAKLGTKDLFLTASLIDHALGAYQSLVLQDAEQRAAKVPPRDIVPFAWSRDAGKIGAMLVLVALGVILLPQWDPFGLHHRQRQLAEQRERIRDIRKATEARLALLEQQRAGEHTEAVKQAVANLEKALLEAKPQDKVGTLARLNEQQKALGQLWKQTSEEKLKNSMSVPPPSQSFGLSDPQKTEQLRNDLQKGDVASAKRELEDLKQKAEQLDASKDPVEREKLRQEMMDRLQSLKDTLAQQLNSQSVDSDLQRALEQLSMSNLPSLSSECKNGLCSSLNLTQKELDQLARAMADMKSLESALKTLQLAKTLHNLQPLDGKEFEGLGDLSKYAAMCEGKCRSLCAGMGMGGGYGVGPRPYGDDNAKSSFQPEKSPSILQPGRMLMEWKTREVSEAGPAREEYLRAVQDVRQQASEAVVQEQIPPGYQAAIKRYFDTLHNDATATSQP